MGVDLCELNKTLSDRAYINGFLPSQDDLALFFKLQNFSIHEISSYPHLQRYVKHMKSFTFSQMKLWEATKPKPEKKPEPSQEKKKEMPPAKSAAPPKSDKIEAQPTLNATKSTSFSSGANVDVSKYAPTNGDYLLDTYKMEGEYRVLGTERNNDETCVILNGSVFHPQGGGQPTDIGFIYNDKARFEVSFVTMLKSGHILHFGKFTKGSFSPGDSVTCSVDEASRRLFARIHSAGHALDVAMRNAGFNFRPTKGHHFPDAPYVEYDMLSKNALPPDQREAFVIKLQDAINALCSQGIDTWVKTVTYDEVAGICGYTPTYLSKGGNIRIVSVAGLPGPCGGTHVKNSLEIGEVLVTKIKVKSGNVRVCYDVKDRSS